MINLRKMIEKVKENYIKNKEEGFLKEYAITPDRMILRNEMQSKELKKLVLAIKEKNKAKILNTVINLIYIRIGTLLEFHKGYIVRVNIAIKEDIEMKNYIEYFTNFFGYNIELLMSAFDEIHKNNINNLEMKKSLLEEIDLKNILLKYGEF